MVATYEALLKAGAYPVVQLVPDQMDQLFYRHGKAHHFDKVSPYQRAYTNVVDGLIRVIASPNTRALSSVDPKKQARVSRASRNLRQKILKKKWTLTLFPTQAYAQDADMSLSEFEDFVYGATFCDRDNPIAAWKALARRQDKLIAKLEGANEIRIVGPDTDLTLSVKGRTFINSAGTHNMPSGEIFTGPVETSAEGHIRYDFPVCHAGREIDGIRLVFRKGKVVEASATKNGETSSRPCSTWIRARGASASSASAPTSASSASSRTSCSTKRSAAPSTSRSASPTPRPAARTSPPCTGT